MKRFESLILANLKWMLDRSERSTQQNAIDAVIDTKVNLITGQDFPADDPLCGKQMVFSWVQGRALESLAGHHAWIGQLKLPKAEQSQLQQRIKKLSRSIITQMESIRTANAGRLFFMTNAHDKKPRKVDSQGNITSHEISPDTPSSFSDLFYAKGLVAAGQLLGDPSLIDIACTLMDRIADDIFQGKFVSDQQSLDPSNPITTSVIGRHLHSPYMIAIGAASLFLQITHKATYQKLGVALIGHILQNYVHAEDLENLENAHGNLPTKIPHQATLLYDMWEYTNDQGGPYIESYSTTSEKKILRSLPGHCTEFAGLGLKFIRLCETPHLINNLTDAQRLQLDHFKKHLPWVALQNFNNGFISLPPTANNIDIDNAVSKKISTEPSDTFGGLGICNSVNLLTHKPLQTNMPWWNLPETIRSACESLRVVQADKQSDFYAMATTCTQVFFKHYVRHDFHQLAIQTLDQHACAVDAIPAVPDADPCYHTGLSLIDVLNLSKNFNITF